MPSVLHSVDSLGIVVISRARIVREDIDKAFGQSVRNAVGQRYTQFFKRCRAQEAAERIRVRVLVRDVGLYIEYGRSVHEICTAHMQHRSAIGRKLDFFKLYR
mgnify:CR=1 FL=1